MNTDNNLKTRIQQAFTPLNTKAASKGFAPPRSLTDTLEGLIREETTPYSVYVDLKVATLFGTAAVDMWLRAVHSFLISASITNASPIWAVVSGYYSSHYSVRALAHLLGNFQLYRKNYIVHIELRKGRPQCTFTPKKRRDVEHKLYWDLVRRDPHFNSDPLFTDSKRGDEDKTGFFHRNWANYIDHLSQYPTFRPLDENILKSRVRFISQITFTSPPIPMLNKFPDTESIQIIAYHRLVKFREFLDEILGGANRFWNVHRDPDWARHFINFQLVEQGGIRSLQG